jgi:flagellar basal-body rod protein FlgG
MLDGMYSAAAGMEAQQQQLDAIGNDLANASTTGYKAERTGFHELLYNQIDQAGTVTTTGTGAAADLLGRDQSQGSLQSTDDPLDIAIDGAGFLTVRRPDGSIVLTRDGALQVDPKGRLTTAEGDLLHPPITLPRGTTPGEVAIGPDGTVSVRTRTVGRIGLVDVASPDHLLAAGGNLFTATAASGAPGPVKGPITVHQGMLEGSNVNTGDEMVQMITTQRGYQLESTAIQTANQMLSIANQLRS